MNVCYREDVIGLNSRSLHVRQHQVFLNIIPEVAGSTHFKLKRLGEVVGRVFATDRSHDRVASHHASAYPHPELHVPAHDRETRLFEKSPNCKDI